MKNGFWLLLYLTFLPGVLFAQDITGIWRGHFRDNAPSTLFQGEDDRYKIEVQIAQDANLFQAVTYSYRNTLFYGKATATGTVNAKTRKVLLREVKLVEVRMSGGDVCIMTCFLQYNKLNEEEYLTGTYTSVNTRDSLAGCGKGTIFLHRVQTSDFHKEPFLEKKEEQLAAAKPPKKPEAPVAKDLTKGAAPVAKTTTRKAPAKKPLAKPAVPNSAKPSAGAAAASKPVNKPGSPVTPAKEKPGIAKTPAKVSPPTAKTSSVNLAPEQRHRTSDSSMSISKTNFPKLVPAVISTRSNEVIRELTVNNESVNLAIYDDGTVDNDTVSVYLDNRLVIGHARISDVAVNLTIKIEPEGTHELVMVADNLGDFPPNTSLMVIRDGEKKYEVRIVSTEQKNAVIRFTYQKP